MAGPGRPKRTFRREFVRPTMTYLTGAQDRALRAACEAENVPIATWIRRLVAAELSRLAVREQLTQAAR